MQRDVDGRFRIFGKVLHDDVTLHERAILGDIPQDFLRDVGHCGKIFNFKIGEFRGLEHGALHDFVRIANQKHALFAAAFDCELDTLHHVHLRKPLQQCYAFFNVGDRFSRNLFHFLRFQHGIRLNFGEQFFLFGRGRFGISEFRAQFRIGTQSIEIVEQRLNTFTGQVRTDLGDDHRGAGGICCQRIGDSRPFPKMFRAIGETARIGVHATDRGQEGGVGLR